jgi:ABC-type multidrug transport system permease subunit
MSWHLGRRELVVFAVIIIVLEIIYIIGNSGPFWLILGFVGPLAILFGINLIVGLTRSRRHDATSEE